MTENRKATPQSPSTAPEVKPWQDRVTGHMVSEYPDLMKAEIADLRAALAYRPAEVDDEGLPLPESKFCAWVQHGRVWNAFPHGVGDKARWDHGGYWSAKGFDREPLFTAEQYRQGQRDAVAADRARRAAVEETFYPQLFLNWNRSQESPPVAIGKEMGVARKAVELSRAAPSHTTSEDAD